MMEFTPAQLRDNFLLQAFYSAATDKDLMGRCTWIQYAKAMPDALQQIWGRLYEAVDANKEDEGGAWAVHAEIEGLYARVQELQNELAVYRKRDQVRPVLS